MKLFGIEVDPRKMADAIKSRDNLAAYFNPEWLNDRDDKRPTLQDAREGWREAVVRSKTVTMNGWPQPKLDVRTVDLVGGMGLALYDRETGEVLPGQLGGEMTYRGGDYPKLTVEFLVDGDDVKLGDNSGAFAKAHDAAIARDEAAMEEAHAANDLQAALRAFGGLTEANVRRFMNAAGFVRRWEA